MRPIRQEPFQKLAAAIQAEQDQDKAARNQETETVRQDYMSMDELEDAETANTRRVSQVYSEKKSE
jgi:hypothetical protein